MKRGDKLPENYQTPEWREVRLDINPNAEPDIVGDIRIVTQPEPLMDMVALAFKLKEQELRTAASANT